MCPYSVIVSKPFAPFCSTASYMTFRHEYGGDLDIVVLGATLDPSKSKVKIRGNRGYVRVRLPDSFYDNLYSITEARALGVVVLDKSSDNSTGLIRPQLPQVVTNRELEHIPNLPRQLKEVDESLGEVGMYTKGNQSNFL